MKSISLWWHEAYDVEWIPFFHIGISHSSNYDKDQFEIILKVLGLKWNIQKYKDYLETKIKDRGPNMQFNQ